MHLVLALNAELPQEWVVDAAARFATQTAATVAVVSVDEVSWSGSRRFPGAST
jgi:hypothetical protein